MSRKTQRVVLKSQAREIISKVYDFMKKEASNNYAEKITDARWRTAQAVGVSESTVTRILRERKVGTSTMKQNTVPAIESNIKMKTDEIVPTVSSGEQTTEPTMKPDIKSEKEASNNYAKKITNARWRTAQAVGVSESTVTRILRERKVCTTTMKPTTVPATESNIKMETDEIIPTVSSAEQTTEPTTKPDIKSEKEASNNYAEKITDARWRTAQAVGVSESTVTRILRERKVCTSTVKQTTVPAIESNIKMEPDEIVSTVSSAEQTTEPTMKPDIKSEYEPSTSHSYSEGKSASI